MSAENNGHDRLIDVTDMDILWSSEKVGRGSFLAGKVEGEPKLEATVT